MRQVTAPPSTRGTSARGNGRWIWGVSGLVTLVAIAIGGFALRQRWLHAAARA